MAQDVQPIKFAVQTYKGRSSLASSERLVNIYAEPNPEDSPFPFTLFGIPGTTQWVNTGDYNPIYGMIVFNGYLYVVAGTSIYKYDQNKNKTFIGTMGSLPGYVQMTANTGDITNGINPQITILTPGGISYQIKDDVLTQITNVNYLNSRSVTTLDNYTIFTQQESDQWFISANGDTSSYAALDREFAQANPGNLIVALNYNRNLVLMKETTTEIWYNSGNQTFPFTRMSGVLIQKGCAATLSAVVDITGYYWLGNDRIIYYTSNFTPVRISTYAIEAAIENYETISDAIAYVYVQNGHRYYVLTFPSANATWVFDISTQLWHERSSTNSLTFSENHYSPTVHVYFNGQHIVNGQKEGILYYLDNNSYSEDGVPIVSEIVSATQFVDFARYTVDKLVLLMEPGVGISQGQGFDPQIMIQISIDEGKTWSKEIQGSLGRMGDYQREIFWSNIGLCRSITFKVKISDPVKRIFNGAYMNITRGLS